VQSLVSAPTPLDPGEIKLRSNFQRRVTAEDHDKTAAKILPTIDHPVVIDLIDERAPLLHTGYGLVAATSYFKQAGLAEREGLTPVAEDAELAPDGPFATAARELAALLPDQPVIVHRAYWALRDTSGEPLPEKRRGRATNLWLKEAYRILEGALGDRARRVEPDREHRKADPGHRWGLAPFHYTPGYYDALAEQIRAHLAA
jgi:hypothetical protein